MKLTIRILPLLFIAFALFLCSCENNDKDQSLSFSLPETTTTQVSASASESNITITTAAASDNTAVQTLFTRGAQSSQSTTAADTSTSETVNPLDKDGDGWIDTEYTFINR